MFRLLFSTLALTLLTGLASAQVSETACRSAESSNFARCSGVGTVSGRDTDIVIIKNKNGTILVNHSIAYLRTRLPYFVLGVDPGSNGEQFAVRISYWCLKLFHPAICGGTVEVWRGSQRRDIDPIY